MESESMMHFDEIDPLAIGVVIGAMFGAAFAGLLLVFR